MQIEKGEGVSYIESGSYVPEAPTFGSADVDPVSFRTPWTAGRDARPMARPIRLRTFYVLLGSRRLGLDGLVARS